MTGRSGQGPKRRLANLARVWHWVRDQDPDLRRPEDSSEDWMSPGSALNQSVLTAFMSFSEDWAEALTAVQARAQGQANLRLALMSTCTWTCMAWFGTGCTAVSGLVSSLSRLDF